MKCVRQLWLTPYLFVLRSLTTSTVRVPIGLCTYPEDVDNNVL
jgi:hypothetical protein